MPKAVALEKSCSPVGNYADAISLTRRRDEMKNVRPAAGLIGGNLSSGRFLENGFRGNALYFPVEGTAKDKKRKITKIKR